MGTDHALEQRLDELEQLVVRQADRIAALEQSLASLQMMLLRLAQGQRSQEAA